MVVFFFQIRNKMTFINPTISGLFTLFMFDQGWKMRDAANKHESVKAILLLSITILNVPDVGNALLIFGVYYVIRICFYPIFKTSLHDSTVSTSHR